MGFPHSNGCDVCRKRKVKCDEGRPTCRRCARAGKLCSGYPKRSLRWEVIQVSNGSTSGHSQKPVDDQRRRARNPQTPLLSYSDLDRETSLKLACTCHCGQAASNEGCRYHQSNRDSNFPHPQDALTTSQREPFQALPIKVNSRVAELVAHYTIDIPRLFYNANASLPIQNLYFPLALLGPVAFQAIVMMNASTSVAKLRGVDESAESLQHRVDAVQAVRVGLSDPMLRSNDEILIAMASFAELENYYGLKEAASTHMKAITSVIRQRGGPTFIGRKSPKISIFLNWVDCLMVGPRNFDDLSTWSPSPPMSRVWHYQSQCLFDLNEFLLFLERVKLQALDQKAKEYKPKIGLSKGTNQRLHRVLAMPTDFQENETHHASLYCRLAALIHIHCALWEYRHQSFAYERYVCNLEKAFSGISETSDLCPGAFTFYLFQTNIEDSSPSVDLSNTDIMLSSIYQVPSHNRLWTVARILRVAKLLSKVSLLKLHRALLSYLCIGDEDENERGLEADWIQGLKSEVTTCPLPYVSTFTNPSATCPFGDVHRVG